MTTYRVAALVASHVDEASVALFLGSQDLATRPAWTLDRFSRAETVCSHCYAWDFCA